MRLVVKELQAQAHKQKKKESDQDIFEEKEALHQAMLKEFNAVDCLKESKMNFLFVAMFAPVKPIGVVFLLVAQIIRLHTRIPVNVVRVCLTWTLYRRQSCAHFC